MSGLDREALIAMVRECAVIVKPGETLLIRVPMSATPSQVRQYQESVDVALKWHDLKFKAMVLPAEELGVAQADTDAAFARRVARAMNTLERRRRFPVSP